jgi:hypothetical protein
MIKTDGEFVRDEYIDENISIYVIDIKELNDELKKL